MKCKKIFSTSKIQLFFPDEMNKISQSKVLMDKEKK